MWPWILQVIVFVCSESRVVLKRRQTRISSYLRSERGNREFLFLPQNFSLESDLYLFLEWKWRIQITLVTDKTENENKEAPTWIIIYSSKMHNFTWKRVRGMFTDNKFVCFKENCLYSKTGPHWAKIERYNDKSVKFTHLRIMEESGPLLGQTCTRFHPWISFGDSSEVEYT